MKKKLGQSSKTLVRIFDALGDETRLRIFIILSKRKGICVSELAEAIGVTTAGVSQHLKIIERVGLIERNRQGQKICYTINRTRKDIQPIINIVLNEKEV